MRIAFFSPVHPAPSGISDYAEELLPNLGAHAEISIVVDGYAPTNVEIAARFRVMDDREYDARDFDLALYQLGNSPAHAYIYQRALREAGVIVLHDLVLHHLVAWLTLNHGDRDGYIKAMREAYSERGAQLAEREVLGLEALNRFEFPLSERVIQNARGVIAHSQYVANAVRKFAPQIPVAIIPHEMPNMALVSQHDARAQLHLPHDALLIGSFGNLGPTKRTTILFDGYRAARKHFPNARLLLVGAASPNFDVEGLLKVFGLREAVDVIGHVPFDAFHAYIAAMDVCVNLRYPTAGETSGAVLRMMAQGKAVIVSRVGWFAELPNDAAAKIDVDVLETEMLRVMLERLLIDKELRAALGANARGYVEQNCAVADAARAYADFLQSVIEGRAESKNYFKDADDGRQTTDRDSLPSPLAREQNRVSSDQSSVISGQSSLDGSADWRDEVARAYLDLGLGDEADVLREVARAIVELGANE